jgi:hypothetical protein
MKKVLPFIFPLVALIIVVFLAYRWYNLNTTTRNGQINEVGEGVEIQDLSPDEASNILRGVGDFKQVELKGADEAVGSVRYEVKDGKVRFSVTADVPGLNNGRYQVWIKSGDQPAQKAFVLEASKGGYMGSAAVSATTLPFDVIVTRESTDDETMETTVLQGNVPREG